MNPLLIAAGGVGALYALDNQTVQKAIGKVSGGVATSAERAAMHALQARSPIAGASFKLAPVVSPVNAFITVRAALVAKFGAVPDTNQVPHMPIYACRELAGAWVAAYDAALEDLGDGVGGAVDWLTDEIVAAYDAVRAFELDMAPGFDQLRTDDGIAKETIRRVIVLVGEMEGAGFSFAGTRPSEQLLDHPTVADGIGAAAGATVDFVLSIPEKAGSAAASVLGDAVGRIVKSPVTWVAVLGVVAWKVIR